jgi:Icc protein
MGSGQALAYLKKFGSVTVLDGHLHQTMQKIEANVTFHTTASTSFRNLGLTRPIRRDP